MVTMARSQMTVRLALVVAACLAGPETIVAQQVDVRTYVPRTPDVSRNDAFDNLVDPMQALVKPPAPATAKAKSPSFLDDLDRDTTQTNSTEGTTPLYTTGQGMTTGQGITTGDTTSSYSTIPQPPQAIR
jgi:hypothetical protein